MKPFTTLLVCSVMVGWLGAEEVAGTAYWPRFRGPNGSGIAANGNPPVEFGPSRGLLWKTPVPPGHSSPVVWDDRVFLTAMDAETLAVLAVRRQDGVVLWRRSITPESIEKVHAIGSPAAPSVVADAQRVYVYFGSFGLVAYDRSGDEVWRRPLPAPETAYGVATSPILVDGRLILQRDGNDGQSEILAIEAATGEMAWRTPRPTLGESYSTPVVWRHDGEDEIVTLGANRVVAYSVVDGAERWWSEGSSPQPIGVPVMGQGLLFASATFAGSPSDPFELPSWDDFAARYDSDQDARVTYDEVPEEHRQLQRSELPAGAPGFSMPTRGLIWYSDSNKDGASSREEWDAMQEYLKANEDKLVAIRPAARGAGGPGDRIAWRADRGLSEVPSPLFYRDRLYLVRDGGMVTSYEAATGRLVLDRRRLGALGQYVASPVAADGRIYAASRRGTVVVFRAGDELDVLARNDLGEEIYATPAIVEDKLYIRTAGHLMAFGR